MSLTFCLKLFTLILKAVKLVSCQVGKDNVYLALSLVGYDEEIKAAMAYVFGTTFVCDNMDNAKKVEIKSVFNILPLYNVGQKSWNA